MKNLDRVQTLSYPRHTRRTMTWPWIFMVTLALLIIGAIASFFVDGVKL